ncbi:DUF551 domain-containing protein [Mediterraneibacter gnavus]|uniref:DUF551 domain-containing protein n=1 Tax=Mediterraneibacter gnavus TaxID=33038 RepID=UPI00232F4365|nr:DUF551 domain-containing protein [Mediterraneibacter gnavus]MDB8710379.1 DUF551 domain-containing protein [Mediterraneibacter gnavus]MDB8713808.1 DUF551 domain-containing protein [Mediterraneibacter gnavus]
MNILEKILEEIEVIRDIMKSPIEMDCFEDGCKYSDCTVCVCENIMDIIRSHMDDVPDNNDGWILVSKKLPERDYETVLCVDADDYYFVAVYTKEDGFRTEDFGADYENIIAWQPLPELYREDKQDEKI